MHSSCLPKAIHIGVRALDLTTWYPSTTGSRTRGRVSLQTRVDHR
jgi:hypothetical protein